MSAEDRSAAEERSRRTQPLTRARARYQQTYNLLRSSAFFCVLRTSVRKNERSKAAEGRRRTPKNAGEVRARAREGEGELRRCPQLRGRYAAGNCQRVDN